MHVLEPAWEDVKREFDAACSQAARFARSQVVHELNQLLRRFRQYKTEEDWVRLVNDGAAAFVRQVAVFSLDGDLLRLRGQVNLQLPEGLSFPLASAAAFQSVSVSNDPLTVLRKPAEVTDALSTPTGEGRAYLFPIGNESRLAAILFAAGEEIDVNALELIAGLASSILERRSNSALHSQISPLPAPPRAARLPAWAGLDEKQRQLHLRAQRFARVTVAGMQLAKPEACRAGREQRDLYLFLQKEIDEAREIYGKQFMTMSSMVDYLHMELVGTAAEGDHLKLGADYPGQLL